MAPVRDTEKQAQHPGWLSHTSNRDKKSSEKENANQNKQSQNNFQGDEQEYEYRPLPSQDCIRLLLVQPSRSHDDPILCDLEDVLPGKWGNYTALSYSWGMQNGDASLCRKLFVGGKWIRVTQNLFEALIRLRNSVDVLRIWIDAVCINQQDEVERSGQVAAMAAKYAKASTVIAWLGEGESSEEDMQLYTLIRSTLNFPENSELNGRSRRIDPQTGTVRSWLATLFRKRYFRRRWMVQELFHANDEHIHFCWGSCSVTLSDLASFIWRAVSDGSIYQLDGNEYFAESFHVIFGLEGIRTTVLERSTFKSDHGDYHSLPKILANCSKLECADPRDRLYALISMDPDFGIEPDYTISTTALYTHFATLFINKDLVSCIFQTLDHEHSYGPASPDRFTSTGLPSWVPDLRKSFVSLTEPNFCKTRDLAFSVKQPGILTYTPYVIGKVVGYANRDALDLPILLLPDNSQNVEFPWPNQSRMLLGKLQETDLEGLPGQTWGDIGGKPLRDVRRDLLERGYKMKRNARFLAQPGDIICHTANRRGDGYIQLARKSIVNPGTCQWISVHTYRGSDWPQFFSTEKITLEIS